MCSAEVAIRRRDWCHARLVERRAWIRASPDPTPGPPGVRLVAGAPARGGPLRTDVDASVGARARFGDRRNRFFWFLGPIKKQNPVQKSRCCARAPNARVHASAPAQRSSASRCAGCEAPRREVQAWDLRRTSSARALCKPGHVDHVDRWCSSIRADRVVPVDGLRPSSCRAPRLDLPTRPLATGASARRARLRRCVDVERALALKMQHGDPEPDLVWHSRQRRSASAVSKPRPSANARVHASAPAQRSSASRCASCKAPRWEVQAWDRATPCAARRSWSRHFGPHI